MKKGKKILSLLLALSLALTVAIIPASQTQAATKTTYPQAVHVFPGSWNDYALHVDLYEGEYTVKNVKTSNKQLLAKNTSVYTHTVNSDGCYGSISIGLYAKKKGTYSVSFDLYDKNNKKVASKKIPVYANNDTPVKKATFAGKTNFSSITTKKSGKFKITLNSGYKLKEITVTTYNKNGKAVVKKIKNGANIKLGLYARNTSNEDEYEAPGYSYYYKELSTSLMAQTNITVTYIDKYTKLETMTGYSIYRLAK